MDGAAKSNPDAGYCAVSEVLVYGADQFDDCAGVLSGHGNSGALNDLASQVGYRTDELTLSDLDAQEVVGRRVDVE